MAFEYDPLWREHFGEQKESNEPSREPKTPLSNSSEAEQPPHESATLASLQKQHQELEKGYKNIAATYQRLDTQTRRDVRREKFTVKDTTKNNFKQQQYDRFNAAALLQTFPTDSTAVNPELDEDCPEDKTWYQNLHSAGDKLAKWANDENPKCLMEEIQADLKQATKHLAGVTQLVNRLRITRPVFPTISAAAITMGWNYACSDVQNALKANATPDIPTAAETGKTFLEDLTKRNMTRFFSSRKGALRRTFSFTVDPSAYNNPREAKPKPDIKLPPKKPSPPARPASTATTSPQSAQTSTPPSSPPDDLPSSKKRRSSALDDEPPLKKTRLSEEPFPYPPTEGPTEESSRQAYANTFSGGVPLSDFLWGQPTGGPTTSSPSSAKRKASEAAQDEPPKKKHSYSGAKFMGGAKKAEPTNPPPPPQQPNPFSVPPGGFGGFGGFGSAGKKSAFGSGGFGTGRSFHTNETLGGRPLFGQTIPPLAQPIQVPLSQAQKDQLVDNWWKKLETAMKSKKDMKEVPLPPALECGKAFCRARDDYRVTACDHDIVQALRRVLGLHIVEEKQKKKLPYDFHPDRWLSVENEKAKEAMQKLASRLFVVFKEHISV